MRVAEKGGGPLGWVALSTCLVFILGELCKYLHVVLEKKV
jgi:hypothetical protein